MPAERARPEGGAAVGDAARERRVALLVGFRRSLAAAIADFLHVRGYVARVAATVEQGIGMLAGASADLWVVSGIRVEPESVAALRAPGSVRPVIVVLLSRPDDRLEQRYRALGIRRILVMPAGADALSAAIRGRSAAEGCGP
ncbi:MAG: hypothetical protein IRZ00_19780 [Gemmatimonadetes bacterium]|nr:hypothetical protein [Gemmatimonadota bacterium]